MIAKSPTLDRVVGGQLCSGCGLCASLGGEAIEMVVAPPGYNRPRQIAPIAAETEAAIAQTCPGAVVAPWQAAPETHPYWGPYHSVATGHAANATMRHLASSGGMLSALLVHALASGRVDAVLHIVADPVRPTRNIVQLSRSSEDVLTGAGSRYAPSSPLAEIERVLAGNERVAFVGKPCDVSALRQLGKRDPRVAERIPLVLSFFCGGIPSHGGTDRILTELGVEAEAVAQFRYRGDGWPGFATATRHDGSAERMSYMDSWGGHLSKTVQFRCKICPDAVGGVADIACADAWECDERGYPLFEEQDGRSLILARTEAGEAFVREAVAAGAIRLDPAKIEDIDSMQPSQARRKRLELSRLLALVATLQPRFRADGLQILAAARRAGAVESLKSFAGSVRRILVGRR